MKSILITQCLQNDFVKIVAVPEGKVCSTILELYNEEAIVVEPAGALSISALELFPKNKLVGKNIVCIVSGSNNDILRTEEIKEKSLFYEGLKHYFLIRFAQRPGSGGRPPLALQSAGIRLYDVLSCLLRIQKGSFSRGKVTLG